MIGERLDVRYSVEMPRDVLAPSIYLISASRCIPHPELGITTSPEPSGGRSRWYPRHRYRDARSRFPTHRKSVFQAHATRLSLLPVYSGGRGSKVEDQLEGLFAHIQKSYPRTKRATHRMWAYRCRDPTQTAIVPPDPLDSRAGKKKNSKFLKKTSNSPEQTANIKFTMASFSDVEPASGPILERLLELNHHEEVVVVVYRWYGGVHIGGDRWRCISGAASEALRLLGAKDGEGGSK